jgi:hypothetical protein
MKPLSPYRYIGIQEGAAGKKFRSYRDFKTGSNFLVAPDKSVEEAWREFKKNWDEEVERSEK